MRYGTFERQILILTILLFCFRASPMVAQQVSAAATTSGQAVGANDTSARHNDADVVTLVKRVWRHLHREQVREVPGSQREPERQTEAPSLPANPSAGESQSGKSSA